MQTEDKVKPLISRIKNKEWKCFLGTELPDTVMAHLNDKEAFRSGHGSWLIGMVWYKGESLEKFTALAIVMDDGGYYKCFAKYAFWHTREYSKMDIDRTKYPNLPESDLVLQCVWSTNHLKKTLRAYLETGDTLFDPDYQT